MSIQRENPLEDYFYNNRKNIIHKWTHYFEVYHRHFQKYIGKECVILEIGVSQGGSLQMWKHYFGEKARVYGIDIMPECKQFEENQIEIMIGSQSDREFLREVKTKIPKIDILIDDGGHTMEQQITTFEELFGHIADDGIYLCEDTHTSYWEDFGGGYQKSGTFIEFTKRLIDQLNAWHIYNQKNLVTDFTKTAQSIHFYDSIVVIEKSPRKPLLVLQTGDDAAFANYKTTETDLFLFYLKLKLLDAEIPKGYDPVVFLNDNYFLKNLLKEKFNGTNWPPNAETMIGYKRLANLEFCVRETIQNGILGDLIETGVWRGGACIYMRALLKIHEVNDKTVWVADSFEGLPKPSPDLFPTDESDQHHTFSELAVPLEEVKSNFIKYGLLDEQVKFLKGWFKDTLPSAPIQKLSLLRLDGDMYESTIDALFYLYPKLSLGGFCIIDDWGAIPACKKAVIDYRSLFNINEAMQEIDWTGIFWKKEMEIPWLSRAAFIEKLILTNNGEL
jgi:23S rRNA U2552 (ribose-2'-O)-methylase RlmE/FtsJ